MGEKTSEFLCGKWEVGRKLVLCILTIDKQNTNNDIKLGFEKILVHMTSFLLWCATHENMMQVMIMMDKLCCTYVYRAYSAGRRAVGDVYPLFR